jgi:hypothetical protein
VEAGDRYRRCFNLRCGNLLCSEVLQTVIEFYSSLMVYICFIKWFYHGVF